MKEHIIKEATKLFLRYGIKAIRMDDIAVQLGISKRTIYEIFGDKENLIMECMIYYHDYTLERKRGRTSQATNIIEEFILLLEDWDNEVEDNYKLMMSLKRFYPNVYERLVSGHSSEGYEMLRKKLKKGVDEGFLLKNVNYDLAVSVFSYSIYGITSNQKAILPNNVSEKEALRYVVTYFFRGIATEKGRRLIDEYMEKEII